MGVQNISSIDELQQFDKNKIILVHFYVDWSDECKNINNILEALSGQQEYQNIVFKKCAAEDFPDISKIHNVTAVPTILFFKNGIPTENLTGADPVALNEKLQQFIQKDCQTHSEQTVDLKNVISSNLVVACIEDDSAGKELLAILDKTKIPYESVDINSKEKTEYVKTFSGSPSLPQLYIKGEFVGDLEIIKKISTTDELSQRLQAAKKHLSTNLVSKLLSLINKSKIMIFMKGEKDAPRCGFSKQLMEILKETGLPFDTFDILSDEEVRQGLKILMDWPTYPQVYVNGEFIGGLDIIKSLKQNGELLDSLNP